MKLQTELGKINKCYPTGEVVIMTDSHMVGPGFDSQLGCGYPSCIKTVHNVL